MRLDDLGNEKNQKIIKFSLIAASLLVVTTIVVLSGKDDEYIKDNKPIVFNEEDAVKSRYFNEAVPEIKNSNKAVQDIKEENQKLKDEIGDIKQLIKDMEKNQYASSSSQLQAENLYQNYPEPLISNRQDNKNPISGHIVKKTQTEKIQSKLKSEETKINIDKNTTDMSLYIPTGSVTKAYLLGGVNAPTMTKGQNSPIPILMKLIDLTIIPNHKSLDLKNCFVLGEAYGDLSDERVHVRLTNLSCVGKENYIDHTIKGYVSDEDGTEGLAGNVISKQGAMLGRALIAGFIDGVGKAFSTSGQIVYTSPLGSTTQTDEKSAGEKLESAGYSGLGKSAEKLSDFYMKMAESIEPRVETLGNKIIDITITEGIKIIPKYKKEIKENQKASK